MSELRDKAASQVFYLLRAADQIEEQGLPFAGNDLGGSTRDLAKPVANSLRAAAERIELHGSALGLPVSDALEIASIVAHINLGYNGSGETK